MKKLLYCFLFFAILIIASGCSSSVNLNDYTSISASGANGFGTAEVTFDSETFINDLIDKKIIENRSIGEGFVEYLQKDAELYADNNGNLSNGDTVVYKWKIDDAALSSELKTANINVKFSHDDLKEDIKGLSDVITANLDEYCKLNVYALNNSNQYNLKLDCSKLEELFSSQPNISIDHHRRMSETNFIYMNVDGQDVEIRISYNSGEFKSSSEYFTIGESITLGTEFVDIYIPSTDSIISLDEFASMTGVMIVDDGDIECVIDSLYEPVTSGEKITSDFISKVINFYNADKPNELDNYQYHDYVFVVYEDGNKELGTTILNRLYVIYSDSDDEYYALEVKNIGLDNDGNLVAYSYKSSSEEDEKGNVEIVDYISSVLVYIDKYRAEYEEGSPYWELVLGVYGNQDDAHFSDDDIKDAWDSQGKLDPYSMLYYSK